MTNKTKRTGFDYWGKVDQRMIDEHLDKGEFRKLTKEFREKYRSLNPPSPIAEERWIYSNIMRVVFDREGIKLASTLAGRSC